jgi:hypothetical protein
MELEGSEVRVNKISKSGSQRSYVIWRQTKSIRLRHETHSCQTCRYLHLIASSLHKNRITLIHVDGVKDSLNCFVVEVTKYYTVVTNLDIIMHKLTIPVPDSGPSVAQWRAEVLECNWTASAQSWCSAGPAVIRTTRLVSSAEFRALQ